MLLCIHLREARRFGDILRVTTDAKLSYHRKNWLDVAWIIGVLRERSVARLAINGIMDSLRFQLGNIGVAILTGLVPRKGQGPRTQFHQGRAAKWTVPPKTLWNGHRPDHKKKDQTQQENTSQPDEVGDILEFTHATAPLSHRRITCEACFANNVASRLAWCRWQESW
jgi:hypothetical protein